MTFINFCVIFIVIIVFMPPNNTVFIRNITQISEHILTFGNYGIGLSQEWRENNNRICPVFYLTENSPSKSILNTLRRFSLKNSHLPKEVEEANYRFFSLIKRYKGEGKNNKSKILYNEKEWRYIPDIP